MRWHRVPLLAAACALAACADDPDTRNRDGGRDAIATDGEGPRPMGDRVVLTPGTPPDAASRFARPGVTDPARAATVLYPLDRVVFPRNVFAPDIQWEGAGAAGDIYRVRITGAPLTVTAYVVHTGAAFRYDWLVDIAVWRELTTSAAGMEVAIAVDRWDSARNEVVAGAGPVRARIAGGSIAGAVYFWTLGNFGGTEGRIVRVVQGTDSPPPSVDNFLPNPPPRPSNGERCAACHGLSRDGNRLAVSLGDGDFGGVYDVTTDLTGPNPTPVFMFSRSWYFAAFNNDGSRVYMTDAQQRAHLLDGNTGNELAPASGALPDGTHPAWSADGARVAFTSSADDAWNPTRGDLSQLLAMPGNAFGAATVLHRGADLMGAPEGGALDAYPTFSPDSRALVFFHGTRLLLSATSARGALYAMPAGGGAAPVRLSNASGGETVGDAWYPNFTPFVTPNTTAEDQVYWLLLYSRRDYGNAQAGTRGTRRRQIWVTAIDTNITPGRDPSHVPYWLPGQSVMQENASAFWAPRPCRANNAACDGDGQCCSGNCVSLTMSRMACQPPPPMNCRRMGESCGGDSDCCTPGLACAGGTCVQTPP